MEFTLARNHAGSLPSSLNSPRTEGAGLANQGYDIFQAGICGLCYSYFYLFHIYFLVHISLSMSV